MLNLDRSEERVLILAPSGRDAALLASALARAGIAADICRDGEEIADAFCEGAGTLLLTEEALERSTVNELREVIGGQPPWSDVPVVVLIDSRLPTEERTAVEGVEALGNVNVLVRPIGRTVFVNAIRSALRARRRQYEVRDHLQKLQASNRAKDEFVAMLAHELRNPLGAMRFALEVVGNEKVSAESARRSRDVIKRQLRRLTRLLDELLDASRVAQRKVQLDLAPTDLVRIAEDAINGARPVFTERDVELVADLPAEPVTLHADADRLAQIIDNLLTNAAKYTSAGGKTTISVRKERSEATLTVEDTGVGVDPEDLERIFELFAQITPPIDRSKGGLGLGLTIARGLTELHGGQLTAQSDGPGRGARFVMRLPVGSAPRPQKAAKPAARVRKKRHVLLAEDNRDARESLRLMLELQGHVVRAAPDGAAALAAALAERPQVGIIDIGLPELDGYELARRLRDRFGTTLRLIALTGYGQPETRAIASAAGFDKFLVKPVDPEELAKALE